jgi:equilibrative nucleoside transporter 1/2/3
MTGSAKSAPTLAKLKSPTHDRDVAVAAFLFTAVGVGYLFPFSALTQPVDYWHKMFPDFNIEFPLTTMYMWVNLIFLFLIVFFGGEPSYTFRVVGGFVGQLIVLICVPSFYFLHLDEYTHYTYIMIATAVAAIATAFVDSVAIGFAAQFPTEVQVALQFGIGFSTLIGSVYRIITKLVFPVDQVVESSLLYFYSGAATILLCIYAYYVILTLPLTQQCVFATRPSQPLRRARRMCRDC